MSNVHTGYLKEKTTKLERLILELDETNNIDNLLEILHEIDNKLNALTVETAKIRTRVLHWTVSHYED